MTYTDINNTIAAGKALAITWADKFITDATLGEKSGCGPLQLVLLNQWILTLEDYLAWNFNSSGSTIDPIRECLDEDELTLLISKIKAITC